MRTAARLLLAGIAGAVLVGCGADDSGQPVERLPTFDVQTGSIEPRSVALPAGELIRFALRSTDGRPHKVLFDGIQGAIPVPAKQSIEMGVGPYKAGEYPASVDGVRTDARLVIR